MNQKVERLLADLQHELAEGTPVVVEGIKDIKAFQDVGVEGKFFRLSSSSMSELAERISSKKVIILTDFDRFGESAAKKLKDFFLNEDVKPDLSFRKRFRRLLGVVHFEQLPTLLAQERNQ